MRRSPLLHSTRPLSSLAAQDASTASDPNPLCSSSLPRKSLTWLDHNTYLGVDSGACHDEPWPSATPLDGSRWQSGGGTYSYG